jgi:hypothetical protein
MTRRFCLTLNLKTTSPSSLNTVVTTNKSGRTLPRARDSGIEEMQIYLLGTRMFIIMDVKRERFLGSPHVEHPAGHARLSAGGKWLPMERVFQLKR